MSDTSAVLLIGGGLAVMLLAVLVAPLLGVIWWPLWLLWDYSRPNSERAARRRRVMAERARVEQLIQMHMTAHKLPDTPINRERVLQALCRPAKVRRGQ